MSNKADIKDGSEINRTTRYGLVYTCNCGWIDVGHAWPFSSVPNQGASHLWKAINNETGDRSPNKLWLKVLFEESMGKFEVTRGVNRAFAVRVGLSRADKESVALGIFMRVSLEFEESQRSHIFGLASDSSFSAEDLVSNLVGFYRVVRPGQDYIKLCEPVSKEAAERVWDLYGAVGAHKNKVRNFRPLLFRCEECADHGKRMAALPGFLDSIRPAPLGTNYRIWKEGDPELTKAPAVVGSKTIPLTVGDTLSGIAKEEYGTFDLWPLVWDQNPSVAVGGNPNKVNPTGFVTLAPLSTFSAAQIEDARRRAATWKSFPR